MPTKIPIGRPINKSQPLFALTPNLNIYIKVDKGYPRELQFYTYPVSFCPAYINYSFNYSQGYKKANIPAPTRAPPDNPTITSKKFSWFLFTTSLCGQVRINLIFIFMYPNFQDRVCYFYSCPVITQKCYS